ncbi:MAG TPA: GAF domain-containing protein [Anaerolineales bacterium]
MNEADQTPDDSLRQALVHLIKAIDLSGEAVLPRAGEELLQSIVDAAARIFGAAAASIALVNEANQTLDFKVSYGEGNESMVGKSIPLDAGLAGYVAMSGQPMAVQNVQKNKLFDQDFAKSTGYVPRSILAMPLFIGDRVIGVMEVLDKINAPTFGMQDMELLGLFARQAALAIYDAQQVESLQASLVDGLRRLAAGEAGSPLLETLDEAEHSESAILKAIASRFYEISRLGESEQQACLDVLEAFQKYAQTNKLEF